MADIVFIAVLFAFIGLCVLYVRGCERIIASANDDASNEASR
jgi:hypothetical protein